MTHTKGMKNNETVVAVFRAVYNSTEEMGAATYQSRELTAVSAEEDLAGVIPDQIFWSTDRGNWTWDGARLALKEMGIDTSAAI